MKLLYINCLNNRGCQEYLQQLEEHDEVTLDKIILPRDGEHDSVEHLLKDHLRTIDFQSYDCVFFPARYQALGIPLRLMRVPFCILWQAWLKGTGAPYVHELSNHGYIFTMLMHMARLTDEDLRDAMELRQELYLNGLQSTDRAIRLYGQLPMDLPNEYLLVPLEYRLIADVLPYLTGLINFSNKHKLPLVIKIHPEFYRPEKTSNTVGFIKMLAQRCVNDVLFYCGNLYEAMHLASFVFVHDKGRILDAAVTNARAIVPKKSFLSHSQAFLTGGTIEEAVFHAPPREDCFMKQLRLIHFVHNVLQSLDHALLSIRDTGPPDILVEEVSQFDETEFAPLV